MKQFDDIFGEKLGKAFSSYNADDLADEGWNSFLAKRNEEKRRGAFILFPWWGRAAAVALVIGLGTVIMYLSVNNQGENFSGLTETPPVKDTTSAGQHRSALPATQHYNNIAQHHVAGTIKLRHAEDLQSSGNLIKSDSDKKYLSEVTEPDARSAIPPDTVEKLISMDRDTLKTGDKRSDITIEEVPGQTATVISERSSGKTKFLAGLSGMMAHVDGAQTSTPGMSVGLYVEQKISGRVSFRPGLAIAMNSLGISSTRSSSAFAYANAVVNGINGTPESFKGQFSVISMEVPLNFVFKLIDRKSSSFYISAGASTVIYLSEHFTGEYVNKTTQQKIDAATGMSYTETKYSSISLENEYSAFSRTDYFGLASISAGYSLPFAKTSTLRIEPFMQFPLDDLTSLDLHVYFTGISMKVSLGRK
jgi:hypothetical protein